ncbi:phytoene desaturase family protein [Streptomyces caniscabiei]|uniref:NAD(P)/FAD-dependent oxidoreductase n=1 Tax=Streptomyces caniscabiei TaxID=2746961 RepID=A0A927QGQ7_9ACTN|nr:NAD(P)/FAD-dependent oxidoreductase [Streptomyces caniscabiei]MBD9725726.1 NAD(P)/FAD-dependent oxidoreductase [Streptomyces caniscabiei]MDX3510010.1 NAD(P)/FAD-dependent oxidoreductase [Streptomyces caniscabiei]MDX3720773.1 NAD(P)/FAD-dependent oxidoreductase [Streptomyces caniscabiei]MDX3729158.1 NAD(P)/FAD-dependent oxidoreductase [Streptomyces caniscabiei]WEO27632.1 NAD(P)/FAD-dependent oxidoreductase [Streptomyces caniscabiei]
MAGIAVIGAGMGAMAAAARLAVAGHRVVVHESTTTYGGAVGRFERDGFAFDTGPGLLPLPAVHRDLFLKTGKEPLEKCVDLVQVDPAARHVFADGTDLLLPNASRAGVVAALNSALGPGAGDRWGDFLVRAREAWDRTRRPLLEEPLWSDWKILAEREPYPSVPHRKLLRTRRAATLAEVGAWELRDPRLTALLESHALAYGLDPRSVPASAAVLPYLDHAFGTWYVRGGVRELARALYERCLARRVEFVFGAEVTGIVEKDGRAAGVELADGTVTEADHVVAGVAPEVLDRLARRSVVRGAGEVPAQRGTTSRLTVLLALRGGRPADAAHRTVVHAEDRDAELDLLFGPSHGLVARPTATVLRPDDPGLVPDSDHEAVTITCAVPSEPDWSRAESEVYEQQAERLIDAAERAVPDLRERLLWSEVRTPADIARATGAEGGAVPAPALAAAEGRWLHPSNTTALPGLFTAGGWSHPGGGLPHAGMSGALVAGLIVEGPDFRGSR